MLLSFLRRLFRFEALLAKRERLRRRYGLWLEQLEGRQLMSATPHLLSDITPVGSNPASFTEVNAVTFFTADDGVHGTELWRTDGTSAGTTLVSDIFSGSRASSPAFLTNLNGTLFFQANDATHGNNLWQSDGTSAGTTLVQDINSGSSAAYPYFLTNVKGTLFFTAFDATHRFELWRSDGTSAGTTLVQDIKPGNSGAYPYFLTNVNGTLFFRANDGTHGSELWQSDGTSAGTTLVQDINPGSSTGYPFSLTNVNGTLFFRANDGTHGSELWRSDGTSSGTTLVQDINPGSSTGNPRSLTNVNGTLFFRANDGTHGSELWQSDGTSAGTTLVKEINPGSAGANPLYLTNVNGTAFFMANDGTNGFELWRSDGTSAGTTLVQDINPGSSNAYPYLLTNVNGTLFFIAGDATHGSELWRSDGTSSGTTLVNDIIPGDTGAYFRNLANIHGTLFFGAEDAHGTELWQSNGTSAGTTLVRDINISTITSSNPASFTNVNGTAFFSANNPTHGSELWRSNGTSAGTTLVKDINPGSSGASPYNLTNVNGTLFFSALDGTDGFELWQSNGTSAGTTLVQDINSGSSAAYPYFLTNVKGTLFFLALDGTHGFELWQSNGTSAGTTLVKDINAGGANAYPRYLTNVNGTLFFSANDGTNGTELWQSNGSSAGTTLVNDINAGSSSGNSRFLTDVNGTLFFSTDDGTHGSELWRSDGSSAGTTLVNDINAGSANAIPFVNGLTNVNGTLFFNANDGTHGLELWRSDGSSAGTTLVSDINAGSSDAIPTSLTNVNGTLFFNANDGTHSFELWRSDGGSAGTTLVKDINPGSAIADPLRLTNVNGTLFIQANDGTHGTELWRSDGSSAGTTLVKDINPGSSDATPRYLSNVNGALFFQADDGIHGTEPWVLLPNHAPVANNDAFSTVEDTTLTRAAALGVLANDTDVDGDTLTATLLAGAAHGTVTLQANGAFVYTPGADFNGMDGFTYTITDGNGGAATGSVIIAVNAVNDAPVANSDSYSVNEDTTLSVAAAGVLGNDTDADPGTGQPETLTALLVSGAGHGTVTLQSNGAFTYIGSQDFNGTDSFTYQVDDGGTGAHVSNTATVTLVVNAVNDAPAANNDSYSVIEDATLTVAVTGVLANDTDVDGDTLTAMLLAGAAHGTVTLQANGAFVYTPGADFNGMDGFTYTITDGNGGAATASVTIAVNAVNDAPVANNDSYGVNEDTTLSVAAAGVVGNDTDVDPGTGQPETLTAVLVSGASHGMVTLQSNGAFTYIGSQDFNGTDSFTYQVDDGGTGAHVSNSATVTIVVNAVNDAPVANDDSYTVNEDTTLVVAVAGVLSNDTDVDPGTGQAETLTALLVSAAGHGTVTLQSNGAFTYIGSQDFNGTDSFTYQVDDGGTGAHVSNSATVTIVVNAVNDAPVANNDSYTVNEGTTLSVSAAGVLGNDTDVDPGTGQPETLTALLVSAAGHGTLTLQGNGAFTYLPSLGFMGSDSFTYQANDGTLSSSVATVSIFVNPGDNDHFVTGIFHDALNKTGATASVLPLITALDDTRAPLLSALADTFINSSAYRSNLVKDLYKKYQGRDFTMGQVPQTDIDYWAGQLATGTTDEQFIAHLVAGVSATSDADWVNKAYNLILPNHGADASGQAYWAGQLGSGASNREGVAASLLNTTEYRSDLVKSYYVKYQSRAFPAQVMQSEIDYWAGELAKGKPDEQVIRFFVSTPEYFEKQGDTGQLWLTSLYQQLLGQQLPNQAELTGRLNTLLDGYLGQRQTVATTLVNSPDYRDALVKDLYKTYQGRDFAMGQVTQMEVDYWSGQLATSTTDEQVIAHLVAGVSATSDADWVNKAYNLILPNHVADVSGQAYWAGQLGSGAITREGVAASLLNTTEYRSGLVKADYKKYLGRDFALGQVTQADVDYWAGQIQMGMTAEQLVITFLSGSEYFLRTHAYP